MQYTVFRQKVLNNTTVPTAASKRKGGPLLLPAMPDQTILSSKKDKLLYHEILLDNGMRVVLISDPTTEKAACAVDVRVLGHIESGQQRPRVPLAVELLGSVVVLNPKNGLPLETCHEAARGSLANLSSFAGPWTNLEPARQSHGPVQPCFLCVVQVRVGSFSDPEDFPGLAHFLEHMLFYASEKYPVEGDYMKFVVRCCSPQVRNLRLICDGQRQMSEACCQYS